MIWSEKYAPKKFTELLFTNSVHFDSLSWLKSWTQSSPILILAGPTGHSKSLLIKIISQLSNRKLIVMDSQSFKNENYVSAMSKCCTITGIMNMVLLEDVEDSFYKEVLRDKKKFKLPIVITCSDKYNPVFLDKDFLVLEVKKLSSNLAIGRISDILKSESCFFSPKDLLNLIEQSNSDLRSVLNTLQLFKKCVKIDSLGVRNSFQVINDILKKGVQSTDDISPPILSLVHTNYIDSSKLEDVIELAESFSVSNLLPSDYLFLPCTKLRCKKMSFLPSKPKMCPFLKNANHSLLCKSVLPYYNLLDKEDSSIQEYLSKICEKYNFGEKIVKKEEIKQILHAPVKEKVFKFKFKPGRSFAVKRDIDIKEFFE